MRALLDRLVFLVLMCFFASRVVISLMRVDKGKVGLSQGKVRSSTVQYPSISLCFDILGQLNTSVLATEEIDQEVRVLDILYSLSFGGIANDRW